MPEDVNRIWLKNYPPSQPATIDVNIYPNLLAAVEEAFVKYKNLPAFICFDKKLTYAQIDLMSRNLAAYFQSIGLVKGDRIVLMMPNILQYPIALYAALRAGLTIVNTNPLYTQREMIHQFNDSEAKAIIILENFAHNLEVILSKTFIEHIIVANMGEIVGGLKGMLINYVVRKKKKLVPEFHLSNAVSFKKALQIGANKNYTKVATAHEDTIMLQYTGGTTGVAKGAMLTNKNLIANMLQMGANMNSVVNPNGGDRNFCCLPLYHIYGFTVNALGLFSMGACNILVPNPRDMASVIRDYKKYRPTIFPGINTLLNGILNNPDFKNLDHSQLKGTSAGGMALQRAVADRWKEVTGIEVAEGWGMTETSPVASFNVMNGKIKQGTIGMPVSSTDMRIVDDNLNPLPVGERGEIQVRGPQVMKGYYKRPEATAETIKDGWLCTGDIGIMDDEGYFKIVDRKKDMILVSGFNVYPNEIEDVLALNPKILEVACVGVKDERAGEVPKVFVVKRDSSLTEAEVIAYARENLTGYKVPKYVVFKTDLPKTNVGKILRRELREQ